MGRPRAAHSLPWPPARFLDGGVSLPPPTYIKGPLGRRRAHNCKEPGALFSSYVPPTSLSPPSPVWLAEGVHRSEGQLHRYTSSCYGTSGSGPNRSTSAIAAGSEIQRSSSFTVCVRVLRGGALCGTKSLHRCCCNIMIYMTLRSATSASSSTLVRERNPRIWPTRVCYRIPVNRYSITNR
jgi:hypothetical protein